MSSPEAMAEKMAASIAEKTGKTVDEWIVVVRQSGHEKHGQIVKYLKGDHGFTHGFANLVAHRALKSSSLDAADQDLVAAQYAGPKADLKPIYTKLMAIAEGLGSGFEAAPKKTYVSLRHKKQFGLIQPSTKTRVDLGLVLKGAALEGLEPDSRLETSGSFNSMVTHRVRLSAADDIDEQLEAWMEAAFSAAG